MSGQETSQPSLDWLGLAGRVCVVTGGGGGIGRATALSLAAAGASVAALDLNEAGLAVTEAELHKQSRTHTSVTRCDTTSAESITAASQAIEKSLGACGVLVNTAAILRPGALDALPLAEWNAVLAVNLTGYFLCAQIFGHQMRVQRRGSLVHISSIAGSNAQGQERRLQRQQGRRDHAAVAAARIANEWGPHGIRSNVVSPGMVITPMSQAFYDTPGVTERRAAVVPSRRVGQPQDMADAILFLASDRSSPMSTTTRSRSMAASPTC